MWNSIASKNSEEIGTSAIKDKEEIFLIILLALIIIHKTMIGKNKQLKNIWQEKLRKVLIAGKFTAMHWSKWIEGETYKDLLHMEEDLSN